MKSLIVCYDHGDTEFYASLDDLIFELEAIDIINQEYEVYDSMGRLLTLSVKNEGFFLDGHPREVIFLKSVGEENPVHLKQLLAEFIKSVDRLPSTASVSLDELIALGVKMFGIRDQT